MRLLLKTERRSQTQSVESSVQTLEGESIIIGRGAAAAIRFDSVSVAPAHASLELSGDGLLIQDLGSVTGTHVNDRPVLSSSLAVGDRIKIGSYELVVYREGEIWGVQQSIEEGEIGDDDPQRAVNEQLRRFDVEKQLPSFLSLSLFILGALGAIYLMYPVVSGKQASWSSGPLAKVHRHLENNCVVCHSEPFAPVRDRDCQACHSVQDHTPQFTGNAHHFSLGNKRCAECHHDHNGEKGVLPHGVRLCSECHANIKEIKPDSQIPDVASWDQHPDFRLTIEGSDHVRHKLARGAEGAMDSTPLKLNHEVHLKKNIRGANGPVTLTCQNCHSFEADKQTPAPISFKKNCQSCHSLEFDQRFPGEQVPHGDTHKVGEFLFTRYSQLFLSPDQKLKSPELTREKPGQMFSPEQYNKATLELIREEVGKAETQLYTRTACQLCHLVDQNLQSAAGAEKFSITPPHIPTGWFKQARFSHRPHLNVDCISCHRGADKSTDTRDVLMPDVISCQECHTQKATDNRIQSECTECHTYHAETALQATPELQPSAVRGEGD